MVQRLIGYRIDGRIYDPDDVDLIYEAADDEAPPPTGGGDHDHPRDQVGVDPTGPAVAAGSAAGPPDLDHAIQAATTALTAYLGDWPSTLKAAHLAVEAAAPHLPGAGAVQWYSDTLRTLDAQRMGAEAELEATRDRLADLDAAIQATDERDHFQAAQHRMRDAFSAVRQGRMTWDEANDEFFDGFQQAKQAFAVVLLGRDIARAEAQATRDRLADLKVYAAELHELLTRTTRIRAAGQEGRCTFCHQFPDHAHCWWCGLHEPSHLSDCPVAHALAVDPPARGRATGDEVQRLRDENEHLRHMTDGHWHDDCWYCRRRREQGGTGIAALDGPAAQEEGG